MKPRLSVLCFALGVGVVLGAAPTMEQLAADPQLWPKEVTVSAATKASIIKDGRPAGMMLIGAGKRITVTGVAADGVTGKLGGTTVKVAVDKTNLLQGGDAAAPAAEESVAAPDVTASSAAAPAARTAMQRRFSDKLVKVAGNGLQPVDDARLDGVKYYALYFSASWCGPCRQFTPGLVRTYRELKAKHPEFEVVFVSADRSAGDMASYMKKDGMPWVAVKFDLVRTMPEIQRYSGPGIPCLVLVDASGRVLSDSYEGDDYVGPGKVLRDAQRILAKGT